MHSQKMILPLSVALHNECQKHLQPTQPLTTTTPILLLFFHNHNIIYRVDTGINVKKTKIFQSSSKNLPIITSNTIIQKINLKNAILRPYYNHLSGALQLLPLMLFNLSFQLRSNLIQCNVQFFQI